MRTRILWAGAAAMVAPSLSSCANPVRSALEKTVEKSAGVTVDRDGDDGVTIESDDGTVKLGTAAELPSDFPADLPIPKGELTGSIVAPNMWTLAYEQVSQADFELLQSQVEAAGFSVVFTVEEDGAVQSQYSQENRAITLHWDGDPDDDLPLLYSVVLLDE